jgi:hypothetical protein
MDTIVFLITISASAWVARYKDRLRGLVSLRAAQAPRAPLTNVLTDRMLGLARLELPDGWRAAHDLNETASIEAIRVVACSGPERRTVGGFDAVQYEIEGFFQQTRVKYLHTTVAGRRAYHQVLAWAPFTRYDRASFERVLNGFSELPDVATASRTEPSAPPQPLQVIPVSQYEVH